MKSLRKLMAVIVSLALMATLVIPSFAAAAPSDAEICETLGMLKGEGEGVTEEYLATTPQRYQAAIMFLRLKGLEEEALAYEGEDNFDDAGLIWEGGQNMLAYLKANPELGWVGIGNNLFDPLSPITAKQYYKVLLTALGYEYDIDFTWDEVLDFAADAGLSEVADVENFTVNDLAIATVEALKADVAEGGQTLIEKLVEEGVAPRTSLYPVLEELDRRRKTVDLAISRSRLLRELAEMVRAEELLAEAEAGPELPAGPLPLAERFEGSGVFRMSQMKDLMQAFELEFGRPLPVSAMGMTRVHKALGFDHRGRVDVALNPDQPEGVWLRRYLAASAIPYLAFRAAIRGQSTAPHIHIGPPSSRLRVTD